MMSMVLADYRARFKYKNIIKTFNVSYIPLIYTFLLPIWNEGIETKFTFWSILICFLISTVISKMYPFELTEIMYLVPLTTDDKYKYLKTAYWVRSIFAIVISIASVSIAGVIDGTNIIIVILVICDSTMVALICNGVLPSVNKTDSKGRVVEYTSYSVKYTILLIFLVLGCFILPFFTEEDTCLNAIMLKVAIIYKTIIYTLSILFLVRNWKMVIQNAMNFEKSTYVTETKGRKR